MLASYLKYNLVVLGFVLLHGFNCNKPAETLEPTPDAILAMIPKSSGCVCSPTLDRYRWRKQTVYVLSSRGPACNSVPLYYTPEGTNLPMAPGYSFDQFLQEASWVYNVWNCK